MGGATEKMLSLLQIETNVNENQYMEAWRQSEQAPKAGFWTMIDKRFVQRYVIRDYDNQHEPSSNTNATANSGSGSTSAAGNKVHTASATATTLEAAANQKASLRRREDSSSRSIIDPTPGIELTESGYYDTLEEMGVPVPAKRRKSTSLFDYGMNKSD
jgi:hypothetical protein